MILKSTLNNQVYKTVSTSSATMDINPIVLRETTTTRLIFRPVWVQESENPLRGTFCFQRKGIKDRWQDVEAKPMSALHKDEEYSLRLEGEEVSELLNHFGKMSGALKERGHSFGERQFTVSEGNAESVLLQIGDIENRDWVIDQLKKLESSNFDNLGSAIGSARLERIIENIEENLSSNEETFWQKLFEDNPWVLQQLFTFPVIYLRGETYLGGKNSKGRQGSGGSATDFLLKNGANGSFAVVEIKTPGCGIVGSCYRGSEGSGENNELYQIHGDLSGGVVQLENQIHIAVEHFKNILGEDFEDLNHLDPIGVLIVGKYSTLGIRQKRSFDLFRKSLGKNRIYTFDEVLEKLKLLKSVYA